MRTIKLLNDGNSQIVLIPPELEFPAGINEVAVFRHGDEIILREIPDNLSDVPGIFAGFPDDFMAGKQPDLPAQTRRSE
jgi:virulence-associated protein VagC